MLRSADGVDVAASTATCARLTANLAPGAAVPYAASTLHLMVAFCETGALATDSFAELAAVAEASLQLGDTALTQAVCDKFHDGIQGKQPDELNAWTQT